MRLARRRFLQLAGTAAALPALPRLAAAVDYPVRPIHFIVGFAAGSGMEITARLIGQAMSERVGQTVVIDNRPGAGTNIATESVVNAPPDGYTILMVSTASFTNGALYEHLNFDFIRDIAPVASVSRGAFVMLVNPAFPAKTIPEFIAYAKAHPGVTVPSPRTPPVPHASAQMFNTLTPTTPSH